MIEDSLERCKLGHARPDFDAQGFYLDFHVDGAAQHPLENITGLQGHLKRLLPLLDVVPVPHVHGQQGIRELPETETTILV